MGLDIRVTVLDGASSVTLHEVESDGSAFGIGATRGGTVLRVISDLAALYQGDIMQARIIASRPWEALRSVLAQVYPDMEAVSGFPRGLFMDRLRESFHNARQGGCAVGHSHHERCATCEEIADIAMYVGA